MLSGVHCLPVLNNSEVSDDFMPTEVFLIGELSRRVQRREDIQQMFIEQPLPLPRYVLAGGYMKIQTQNLPPGVNIRACQGAISP